MERIVYDQMAELDERHWWYRARREVLAALIRRLAQPKAGAHILEIGCGTGHNLPMLSGFGKVDALELDEAARELAEKRLGRKIMRAPLPEIADVRDKHYDLIGAFDFSIVINGLNPPVVKSPTVEAAAGKRNRLFGVITISGRSIPDCTWRLSR